MPAKLLGLSIPVLEDLPSSCNRILLRIDVNSPIDPATGRILDDTRFRAHRETILELLDAGKSIAVLAHQGRPGEEDFTSLEAHAETLSRVIGVPVKFVEDVIGPEARKAIKALNPGEVLMLDNTRLVSEDYIEAPPEVHAKSIMVRRLSEVADCYVNDAFAASHRSQASLVGFPLVMPSAAGRLMQKELEAVSRILESPGKPKVFVIGGSKLRDMIEVIEHTVKHGIADYVLTTGLVALLFLNAKGVDVGEAKEALRKKGGETLIARARRILETGASILMPRDFIVEREGETSVNKAENLRGAPKDIGPETIAEYSRILREARLVVMKGPAGVIEDPRFRRGTEELVKASLEGGAYTVFGGGHFNVIISSLDEHLRRRVGHISTGGGALVYALTGRTLPAVEALSASLNFPHSR